MIPKKSLYCTTHSLEVKDQRFGTAPRVDYWFLLEAPEPYGKKALEESGIPKKVKTHLNQLVKSIPNSRLQLVKRGNRFSGLGISFFVVVCHEEEPNLYEFRLSAYEDLLQLDLPGITAEERAYWAFDRKEPLFLICTNGKRDRCCARFGLPVYQALMEHAQDTSPPQVWETSHVGGHRFAGNVICLPHGLYYGHVTPEEAPVILETYQRGEVYLDKYRGRACYDRHVQAAEFFLRQQSGERCLGRFKLVELESLPKNVFTFHFAEISNSHAHCIQLRVEESVTGIYKSCGDETPVSVPAYHLLDYQAYPGLPGTFS